MSGGIETDGSMPWRSVETPKGQLLTGRLVELVSVDPIAHAAPLFVASHNRQDPELWTYLFVGPFPTETAFGDYLQSVADSPSDIFFTIVDRTAKSPSGIASYLRIVPEHGVIEIGHIWFGVDLQRTAGATEAIFLLARHVFDDLGYRRLEWKCDALNARSRRAALRFGFSFEGIFRQHMVIKGRNRDTAWFAMIDKDWPRIRAGFEAWLAPDNFDAAGQQRQSLSDLMDSCPIQ